MLFTETDSLTYKIGSENVYEEFLKCKHLFGFSIFPKDSKFFEEANKKVFVKTKDVSRGNRIDEFVGLKSKKYSIKYIDGKESNTAKGVYISTEFNEFKDTLLKKKILRNKMRRIQAKSTNLEHMKSTMYHYHVLMTKDLFQRMTFIRRIIFIKDFSKK